MLYPAELRAPCVLMVSAMPLPKSHRPLMRAGIDPSPYEMNRFAMRDVGEGFMPSRKWAPTEVRGRG